MVAPLVFIVSPVSQTQARRDTPGFLLTNRYVLISLSA